MNYEKLYSAFINKYKNQEFEVGVYTEKHHIIPRHAGGDDSKENLIRLTYKQHTFAHRLLWKIYGKAGDYHAWLMMSKQESDKKLANLKAIGKANVVSGHMDRIRELANTPERQRKLKELNQQKVESGELYRNQQLANIAWRGSSHTEEYKQEKKEQMTHYRATEKGYAQMLEAVRLSVEAKRLKSYLHSLEVLENAERNEEFLQETSSRSKNVFISPEGLIFDSPIFAAKYYGNVAPHIIEGWCKGEKHGWSRKPKAA